MKSCWQRAYKTPNSELAAPRASIVRPKYVLSGRKSVNLTSVNRATLIITPDIRAETFDGAAG